MAALKKLTSGMEGKYWLCSFISPVFMVFEVLMETTIPLVMARLVDVGIANRDQDFVVRYGLMMVGMASFSLFSGSMCGWISSIAAFGFSKNLRRLLFNKVQSFSFSNMDKFRTGSLVTRLTTDVTNLQNMYQNMIRTAVRCPLMLVLGTVMACTINLKLAGIFFVVIPLLAVAVSLIVIKVHPRFVQMFKKYDRLNSIVQENLIAIRVVKAFVREKYETDKFDFVADDLRDNQVNAEKIVILNLPIMQLMIYSCIVSALWFGGNMILGGKLSTGELISFLSYISQTLMSLMMLSRMFVMFIMSRTAYSRISEVLDEIVDITDPVEESPEPAEDNSIDFENVYFSYDKKKEHCVLSGVNLHIPAGATVGILGGTGSSKSTLVQMIPRLYDVLEGKVCVGKKDVRTYKLDELRRKIGFVLQKNVLFSGTIEENLKWGNEDATEEEILEACRAADADSFIQGFPKKYETVLEQGGVNLSGGQKQRLCIARALVKKPEILIFDDSTSAVDTATDLRIRNAIKNSLSSTTKLIIAQRIASVQDSDFIVVLDGGKINDVGRHEELLGRNEIYKEIFESQMSEN